jgi:hypothetical protein
MTKVPYFALVCAGLAVAFAPQALAEDYRGTPEQQAACRPDVLKLCGPEIPNVERITQCLRYYDFNKKLSPECSAVFAEKRH